MEYSFEPYLEALDTNWFEDDRLLRRLLRARSPGYGSSREPPPQLRSSLVSWGERVAGRLRELAEQSARPESRPRLRHHDAYGRRVDEILLPRSTHRALAEVEGEERLGAPHGDLSLFYAKTYLCWQNGEAGVACSMGCTDGLVRVLEALGDRPEHAEAVARVRGSTPDRIWHGAQFVTEIQGGSDVRANSARAVPAGEAFRIHGRKWFCSNVNADYFLVTARPGETADGPVGLFLVPAYLEGEAPARNGYTIDRLKDKLGTHELATAEVTFRGALAFPVGPLEHGLRNLVRHVLVPSRFACVISAAAFLRRAERIVTAYARHRTAFGTPIGEYPLVRHAVEELGAARARTLAVVFELLRLWEATLGHGGEPPPEGRGPVAAEERGAGGGERNPHASTDFRVLLSLAKSVLTREATAHLRAAMGILAGNGIEERFSPLPRLFRDSVIMETWEGTHNVLLVQALRDLVRLEVEPEAFVERTAGPGYGELAAHLSEILRAADEPDTTLRLPAFASALVHAAGERVLGEIRWR